MQPRNTARRNTRLMRTVVPSVKRGGRRRPRESACARKWHVIDAEGQVLGRVATLAARLLQGKHKAVYTPLHRHRRSRRRRQRRRGEADRPQGRPEDLSPPQRLRRRPARRARGRGAQAPAGAARGRSGARHAAQDEDGRRDVPQAQGVRESRSSARRSATGKNRGRSNVGEHRILRNRSAQDVGRPCVPPSRHGRHHGEPP